MTLSNLQSEMVTISIVDNGRDIAIDVIERARAVEMRNHQFNLGDHLATAGASIVVGAINPVMGIADALSPFGTLQEQAAARSSIDAVAEAGLQAVDVAWYQLDTVFITRGDSTFSVQTWPSSYTQQLIELRQ
jgi:hypothetical protein